MGSVTSINPERDAEDRALDGLLALIEREVTERVRPLEEALEQIKSRSVKAGEAEEYLTIEALSVRINTPTATIRDWYYKRNKNRVPIFKAPTGGLMCAWSEFEKWLCEAKS